MAKKSAPSIAGPSDMDQHYRDQDDLRTHLQHTQIMKDSKRSKRLRDNLRDASSALGRSTSSRVRR